MINYDGRLFRVADSSDNGQVGEGTIFKYSQRDDMLTATYSGGDVKYGQIIGRVDEDGNIKMRYQHMSLDGTLMTGKCRSRPEMMKNGKVRLYERWQWTCGDKSKGESMLEEI